MTENEIVGWHHQLYGHESGQTPEDGEGQGSLVCRSPWGHKASDTTERLNRKHNRVTATWTRKVVIIPILEAPTPL